MARPRPLATLLALGVAATALAVVSAAGGGGGELATAAAGGGPAVVTPVLSARRVPELLAAPAAERALRAQLDAVLDELPATSCAAAVGSGRTVLDVRADAPVVPASTMKLLTALAVLTELDPSSTFVTRAVTDTAISGGVIDGDLWLVGGGDPVLQTPGYEITWEDPDRPPPHTDLSVLADRVAAAGVTRVTGAVVGDDTRYDGERYPASWPERYLSGGESGPLSALSVNDGFTGLADDPDTPQSGVAPGDPPLLAAETFVSLLADRGVAVAGGATVGVSPKEPEVVAELESPPLAEVVGQALTYSDNTTAELLLKELGLQREGAGSTAAGARAVEEVLASLRIPTRDVVVVDGSGLDPGNRVTCDVLVAVLAEAGPEGVLADGLAVAGEPGTLRRRLKGTDAVGALRGKTGTLAGVSALAGWIDDAHGEPVAFALVANGEAPTAQTAQDQLVLALMDHPVEAPVDALGPR